jgi:EAL domain-containing protein (putative c-di-GMP-specific phosphodiesterase class I)
VSLGINKKCIHEYLTDPVEMDLSKVRISASRYKHYSEIVITPMFCPICEDIEGIDMKNLPFLLSERFIRDHCEKIIDDLSKSGFDIIRKDIITGTSNSNDLQQG